MSEPKRPDVMKERPILFNSQMVRVILDGRKTQTRRVIKPQPIDDIHDLDIRVGLYNPTIIDRYGEEQPGKEQFGAFSSDWDVKCPHGIPGDRLWVKEGIYEAPDGCARYTLDDTKPLDARGVKFLYPDRWKRSKQPAMFCPRWASRITLEIAHIRAEKLQDISGRGVFDEGVDNGKSNPKMGKRWENMQRMAFEDLWDSINAKRGLGWGSNPWVWVIEFRRIEE